LFATQFLDEAEGLADRVAILSKGKQSLGWVLLFKGKFLAVGSVQEIKENFGTGYTLVLQNR